MDISTLVACFDASFSPDANVRIASELELRKLERLEGMPACVLSIVGNAQSTPSVRQAAAVYLKNRISRSWASSSSLATAAVGSSSASTSAPSNVVPIHPSDRTTIKQNILPILVEAPQNVKIQLKTALSSIVSNDFPEKWSELPGIIVGCITSGNEFQIEAGLLALIETLKLYRYRRTDREVPQQLCAQFMPLLVNLGQQLLANNPAPSAPEMTGKLLHYICKAYKISIVADLSPHQASNESILQWGTFLLQVVHRIVPEEAQPSDPDDREKWSWWKAKKWAHQVLNRLYNYYGSPSQLPSNRANFKAFAQNFEAHFAPEILKAYLACVERYASGQVWMSKRCSRFVLEFFEDCVKPKSMWGQLKPHLDLLIERFVFPCLCLTDDEIEQFDEDPIEYARSHFGDFLEDFFSSPLTAAISFVQVLTKARKALTLMPILNTINSIVSQYPEHRTAKEKDGALRLLSCLAPVVVKTKGVGERMQDFFISYVFPEFSSPVGFLRVRALDMVEKFEEQDMAWPDSKKLTEMFNKVMVCVTDEALPVRVQAALALPELVRYDEVREGLAANVGRLMQELLKLSEETDIDPLSKPTRALVTNFPDELLPFATDISTQMRDSYLRIVGEIVDSRNKANPDDFLNGLDKSGGPVFGDDDEKTLVAMNTLQTIETLLRSVSSAPPIVAQLESILLPVLKTTVQHDLIDLFDDLFELAHSLTYYQRSISLDMWTFFEDLYRLFKSSGIDFIEEMVNVFDNYVSYGGPYLAAHEEHKNMFLDIYETAIASEQLGASDRVSVTRLAGQTMLCLRGNIDSHIERYVNVAMSIVARGQTSDEPVVTAELHANSLELIVTAVYYNPTITLSILQRTGQVQKFFTLWFKSLPQFTRVHDRKICILAITAMLTSMPNELADMTGLVERLANAALTLFDGLPKALEARREAEEEFAADDDEEVLSDDDDDEGLAGDEDDVYDEDNDYAELLASKQLELDRKLAAGGLASNGHDDDVGEEDEDDEEAEEGVFGAEQLFETPLDQLDSYQIFSQAIQNLQQGHPNVFQQATGSLGPNEQRILHDVVQRAHNGGEKPPKAPTASGSGSA